MTLLRRSLVKILLTATTSFLCYLIYLDVHIKEGKILYKNQDLSKINVENLSNDQKESLMITSLNSKQQKAIKNEDLQKSILNLENNNFPVGEFVDQIDYRFDESLKDTPINSKRFLISLSNLPFGKTINIIPSPFLYLLLRSSIFLQFFHNLYRYDKSYLR